MSHHHHKAATCAETSHTTGAAKWQDFSIGSSTQMSNLFQVLLGQLVAGVSGTWRISPAAHHELQLCNDVNHMSVVFVILAAATCGRHARCSGVERVF